MSTDYAGDLSPLAAWDCLAKDTKAELIDVRSEAEWRHVGLPNLSDLSKEVHLISWQFFPDMRQNLDFVEEMEAKSFDKNQCLLFLCRSGVRSKYAAQVMTSLGYTKCFNVAEGFEGDRDQNGHRGTVGGWKKADLPWSQA
ncbi:MAG: rhodanese-like domain-containing protein [Pseudomonadota bacterium]